MIYKLLGLQHYDFLDREGKRMCGNKLHLIDERPGLQGMEFGYKVETISLSEDLKDKLISLVNHPNELINKQINLDLNKYGKPECITLVK